MLWVLIRSASACCEYSLEVPQHVVVLKQVLSKALLMSAYNTFSSRETRKTCGYSLEGQCQGTSNVYSQHMFTSRNKKNIDTFWLEKAPYQELCT